MAGTVGLKPLKRSGHHEFPILGASETFHAERLLGVKKEGASPHNM